MRSITYYHSFPSDVMVTNLDLDITYQGLCAEIRDICQFDEEQPFTMKWVDEEGTSISTRLCKSEISQ